MTNIDLRGQVAIVTGGTRGIGGAISFALAQAGATVAANYVRDSENAKRFAKKAHSKGLRLFLAPGDVSDVLEAESVVDQVIERTKRIDILVNNAGIWEPNPIGHPRAEELWDRTLKINLKSAFNMCAHVVRHMKGKQGGRIVNIASTAGERGEPRYSDYAASKGGMIAMTRSLAVELAPRQIHVNCVAPGWVWTEMTSSHLRKPTNRKNALREIPLGRIAQPEDVAGPVLFLVSPLAHHITGEVINVNGGSVLI